MSSRLMPRGQMHSKYVEAQTFSRWCGVEVKRGMPAQVSSSSLDHGSKFRGPSPRANMQLYTTRGHLATDHVILNHGQVTWTTPELAPPLLTTIPHQRKDVSALDRFNVHRCPARRVLSGTGLELVTRQATIRYLYHSATTATSSLCVTDLIKIN
ncbi:uncharacterized protein TNCV_1255601 [Trichonephila clavipes]|nr:uncharacterized protein TNCV_1255601 [Trichonephila clavipes]